MVRRLRRDIHLGRYVPGDKLPPEREHATQLGVSRVTLREAIRVLEGEGLVGVKRGSAGGVTVTEKAEPQPELRASLRRRWSELESVFDFRMANECCAAQRAAVRIDSAELDALVAVHESLKRGSSISEFRQADSQFHLLVASAARAPLVLQAVEDARVEIFLTIDALNFEILRPRTVKAHEAILRALERRDPDGARRAMRSHLLATTRDLKAAVGLDDESASKKTTSQDNR